MPTGSPGEGVDGTTWTNSLHSKYCFRHLSPSIKKISLSIEKTFHCRSPSIEILGPLSAEISSSKFRTAWLAGEQERRAPLDPRSLDSDGLLYRDGLWLHVRIQCAAATRSSEVDSFPSEARPPRPG